MNLNKLAKPNTTIRKHTDDLLERLKILYGFGYIDNRIYILMNKICEYHDYGKINKEFQKRVSSDKFIKFDSSREVAHNVLSILFIDKKNFDNDTDYYLACYAILNHHHYVNNYDEYKSKIEMIKIFATNNELNIMKSRNFREISKLKNQTDAKLLKGLLHKCDYAASGNYVIEYRNDFLVNNTKKYIENVLNSNLNKLQEFCYNSSNENIIVVANTGMGKTEAGLLWIGDNKGFFILPLRTAVNAIYDRILTNIAIKNNSERVALLHSNTIEHYLNNENIDDEKVEMYFDISRNLSVPLTVSTLDQIFDFVYKYNGSELKLATLSYSKIVIDEIQAYSPDLLAYLVLGLEMINEIGGKFAILTATLPPYVRYLIEEKIGKIKFDKFVEGELRHNLEIIDGKIDDEFNIVLEHYKLKKGKNLIICNTVKKCQIIYNLFKKESIEVNLFHSKFIKNDRYEKEKEILDIGKTEKKSDCIWVTTSIVEASLDIDFDYLFTELNDLNGLFQRLGRVNRKGIKKNVLNEANAFVFTEIDINLLRRLNGNRGFIDETIFNLSKDALLVKGRGYLSEIEKFEMINKTLTYENIKKSNFLNRYNHIKKYINDLYIGEKSIKEVKREFRNILSINIMPEKIYNDNKEWITNNLEKINDTKLDKKYTRLDILKLKKEIENLTVSIQVYEYSYKNKVFSIDNGKDEIIVLKCNYSFEIGFIKNSNEEEFNGVFI